MNKLLKEIGTEYQEEYPPDSHSTNPFPHRVTWRVVGYANCQDEFGRTFKAERIEAIKIEELPAPSFIPFKRRLNENSL